MPRTYDHGRGADATIAGAEAGAEAEIAQAEEAKGMARIHRGGGFYAGGRDSDNLDELKKAELLELADERGVDVSASDTKAEIVAALRGE